jgi:hypothetical protein
MAVSNTVCKSKDLLTTGQSVNVPFMDYKNTVCNPLRIRNYGAVCKPRGLWTTEKSTNVYQQDMSLRLLAHDEIERVYAVY